MENIEEQPKKRTGLYIAIAVVVLLLTAAAFVGGGLLKKQHAADSNTTGSGMFTAKELPQSPPEIVGMVSSVDGSSLFVQEFNMNENLGMTGGSGVVVNVEVLPPGDEPENAVPSIKVDFPGSDGPITEVVISRQTKIYRDATMDDFEPVMVSPGESTGPIEQKFENIEQKVVEGSATELGANTMITIWGERTGDRVVASVILYTNPMQGGSFNVISGP